MTTLKEIEEQYTEHLCRAHTDGREEGVVRALVDVSECVQTTSRVLAIDFWLRFIVQKELDDLSPAEARRLIQKRAALLPS
jgi:hypothetical protein